MEITQIKKIKDKNISEIAIYVLDKFKSRFYNRKYKYRLSHIPRGKFQFDSTPQLFERSEISISSDDDLIATKFCEHEFDILGSGWIDFNLDASLTDQICFEATSLFNILNPDYRRINWWLEPKKQYIFSAVIPSEKIPIIENKGLDIKYPWELSRCQHLPYLARLFSCSGNTRYATEIQCQILDFISANRVGVGVNWMCPMDVSIRAANIIISLKILSDCGCKINDQLSEIIYRSLYEHLVFIRYHLENHRNYRGNHYLSDIVGILFISAFMPKDNFVDNTYKFAKSQLLRSILEQFNADGSNFEASAAYHKLSLELALYGLWVISVKSDGKKESNFLTEEPKVLDRIISAMRFMQDLIKPNDDIYQIGDNDSGHLFRFYRVGRMENHTWIENELSTNEIQMLINTVLGKMTGNNFIESFFSLRINKSIARDNCFILERDESYFTNLCNIYSYVDVHKYHLPSNWERHGVELFNYPDFGVCGIKTSRLYLGVSYTSNGQNGRGGHSHNDKLSFELQIDNENIEADPGTFVYTSSLEQRNLFRSTLAHNAPYFGVEQNPIGSNCFQLIQKTKCTLLKLTRKEIALLCEYDNISHIRRFLINENELIVEDYSNHKFVNKPPFDLFSNGYGKIMSF